MVMSRGFSPTMLRIPVHYHLLHHETVSIHKQTCLTIIVGQAVARCAAPACFAVRESCLRP